MIEKRPYWVLGGVFIIPLFMLCIYHYLFVPKVAYVQTDKLVYGYEGMKEYQEIYKKKASQLKGNLDSLEMDFKRAVDEYNAKSVNMSIIEKKEKENLLGKQEGNLLHYRESVQAQMTKDDSEMTGKALEQISSFVQDYGKKKGYQLILGTTDLGSLLYGSAQDDITEMVLKDLNTHYKGKSE